MENLIEENKKLKEKIAFLENIINRGNKGNISTYNTIRGMIINKVANEYDLSQFGELEKWERERKIEGAERNLMSDLKWELRVRRTRDFREDHIKLAEEYIKEYKFE